MVKITNFDATVNKSSICNVTPNICNDPNFGHRLQDEQDMSIIHHNVNILSGKVDENRLYLNSHYPVSVHSCSETFLNSNILDHQVSIEGYTIIRKDRNSKDLGWLNIKQRGDYFVGLLIFKSLNNLLPDYITDNFTMTSDTACRYTRFTSDNKLFLPKANKAIYSPSLEHSGPLV